MFGANDDNEALVSLQIVHDKLASACLPLCKYMSNLNELLQSLNTELVEKFHDDVFEFADEGFVYVLGLIWCPQTDVSNSCESTC